MKADEVRLYALRGGLKKQSVCYTHFHSNKAFRGDHNESNVTVYLNIESYGVNVLVLEISGVYPQIRFGQAAVCVGVILVVVFGVERGSCRSFLSTCRTCGCP